MGKRRSPIPDRVAHFWSMVDQSAGASGCWPWLGGTKGRCGYGEFWDGSRRIGPHRQARLLAHGSLTSGLMVCHTCDNKLCCNPVHLYEGTAKDNARDAVERQRYSTGDAHYARREPWRLNVSGPLNPEKGEDRYNAKLTEAAVREIRARHAISGIGSHRMSREYGVSRTAIENVITGKRWAHVN